MATVQAEGGKGRVKGGAKRWRLSVTNMNRKRKFDIPQPNVEEMLIEFQGNPFKPEEVQLVIERFRKEEKEKVKVEKNEETHNREV